MSHFNEMVVFTHCEEHTKGTKSKCTNTLLKFIYGFF